MSFFEDNYDEYIYLPVTDDGRLKFYNVSHCITI